MVKKKKDVLIIGGSGLLAVNWALKVRHHCNVTLLLHHQEVCMRDVDIIKCSLADTKKLLSQFKILKPDMVINCAGLTNVEACEKSPDLANRVNVEYAKNIACICNLLGVKLIHISTDHLFSGEYSMVDESISPNPVNTYGKTKRDAEIAVLNEAPSSLIIRTNFFGWGTSYRRSFSDWILFELKSNNKIHLFKDVFYTPIIISELVGAVNELLDLDTRGIIHVVGNERISKYEFGIHLAEIFELDTRLIIPTLISEKDNLVERPKDMSLSNGRLINLTQISFPDLIYQLRMLRFEADSGYAGILASL